MGCGRGVIAEENGGALGLRCSEQVARKFAGRKLELEVTITAYSDGPRRRAKLVKGTEESHWSFADCHHVKIKGANTV